MTPQELLDYLETIKFPKITRRSVKSRGTIQAINFSECSYKPFSCKPPGPNKSNFKYPELYQKLKEFAPPGFSFNCITLNKNVVCEPHRDIYNKGLSYIIGLGDYTGGELVIEGQEHNIKNHWLLFNGKKTHWTKPFTGTRYSIVYYNNNLA